MKRMLSCLLVAVLVLSVLSGCGSKAGSSAAAPAAAPAKAPIKLGGMAPLTGNVSVYGIAASNGITMAIDEINAAGGVNGSTVDITMLDEKGDLAEAVNAYQKLKSGGMVALLGDVTTGPSLAVAELAAADKLPMMTPTGTGAAITEYGPSIFRACFIDPFQGQVMATYAAENLKAKKAAVLYNISDEYSSGIAETFKATCAAKNIEVVAYEGYGASDTDFKTQLTSIVAAGADALLLPDYYNTVALIVAQAKEVGYTGALLGADGWDGVLGVIGDNVAALDNACFCSGFNAESTDKKVVDFLKNYKAKYGAEPNMFAALGYDAAYMMCNAIAKAGSTDSAAITAALAATNYAGVTGSMTFDANRNPIKSVAVLKIKNGAASLDTMVSPS